MGRWLSKIKPKIKSKNDDFYLKLSENKIVKKSLDKYFEKREKNKKQIYLTFEQKKIFYLTFVIKKINYYQKKIINIYMNGLEMLCKILMIMKIIII